MMQKICCDANDASDNYLKTSEGLWQYYRGNPNDNIVNSELFRLHIRITGTNPAVANVKGIKISLPFKYLSNFLRTLVEPLINC